MCGITGFFMRQENFPVPSGLLQDMNRVQTHRGPDGEGYYREGPVGLAMRRLKVIDLETGDQPISNDDQSLWIIFNGEIYNYRELREGLVKRGHRFKTHSDTEVILRLYQEKKEGCLKDLIGMFAFTIWDAKEKSLFIARDRLGVKPLFYHESKEGVSFSSEIKSLFQVPWIALDLNPQALSHYFSLNYLPPPWTPVKGIEQLEPGHWMKITHSGLHIQAYWDIPQKTNPEICEEEALEEAWKLLHISMQRRLIADVPVGAFLSGGLDSSTLVHLMKEHHSGTLKTFSVGFGNEGFDETPYARTMAEAYGTDHHEIICGAQDAVRHLPDIAWHADGLLGDQAALPLFIVSKLAREHVTVALSGDGGDEIFVGYPTFSANRYRRIYNHAPGFLRDLVSAGVKALPVSAGKLSLEYKAKKFIQGAGFDAEKAHYWWRTIYTPAEKNSLFTKEALSQIKDHDAYGIYDKAFQKFLEPDFINKCLYADMKVWLPGNNLAKVDFMTMAHGLEARVPFLDHELVEFMASLPGTLKFRSGVLKSLMKKMIKGKLPDVIVKRRKAGFHAPVGQWLRTSLYAYTEKIFRARNPLFQSMINPETAVRLLQEHSAGTANHGFKLWGLLVFWHWADRFGSGGRV